MQIWPGKIARDFQERSTGEVASIKQNIPVTKEGRGKAEVDLERKAIQADKLIAGINHANSLIRKNCDEQ
jgi:hypothetical protein